MAAIGTRLLKLEIDGDEFSAELTNGRISAQDSDSDTVTFADTAAGGGKEYHLQGTAVQDAAAGSLWDKIFTASGTTVPFTLIPYGNAVPTAAQPHFTGNVTIAAFDGDFLGGDANTSATARFTFDLDWTCDGKPTRVAA